MSAERLLNYGICIFVFLLPWQIRWIFGGVEIAGEVSQFLVMSFYATQILLAGLFVFALLKKKIRLLPNQVLGLGAILFAVILSFFFAIDALFSLAQCIHLVAGGLLFILIIQPWVHWSWIISSFALGLVLPVFLGIFQMMFGYSCASSWLGLASRDAMRLGDAVLFPDGTRILRAYGTFPHPNMFGGYLAIAIILFYTIRDTWKRYGLYFYLIISILTLGLVITASQSAWLALLVGCGIFCIDWMIRLHRASFWMVVSGMGFAILIGCFAFLETQSISDRLAQYLAWPHAMQGGWIFGHGVGSYPLALANALPGQTIWEYQPIHNIVLLILSDIGLIGMVLVALSIVLIFFKKNISLAFAPLIALCPIFLLDHYLWTFWSGLALVVIVGAFVVKEPYKN